MALQLTRLRAPADLAAGSRSLVVMEDGMPPAIGSSHLMSVPPSPQASDRPAKVHLYEILTAWRVAERALGVFPEGSPERARVHVRLVGLRASYHRHFAERCDPQRADRGSERLAALLNSCYPPDGPIAASRASRRDSPAAPHARRR
jgi:hypothetical protein